jgi:hypothetical protein
MNRVQILFITLLIFLFAVITLNGMPTGAAIEPVMETAAEWEHSAQVLVPAHTLLPTQVLIPIQAGGGGTPELMTTPINVPTLPPRDSSATQQTPAPPLSAQEWRNWPVIPVIPESVHAIYLHGLELGNDLTNYSTIGDCQSVPLVFMGDFDERPEFWPPYDYTNLTSTLFHFQGSFGHRSGAVANGMSAASVFSPFWADLNICEAGETPLECEFRLQKPVIVFINLGTNFGELEKHEEYLLDILDFVIAQGAVPVLSTKGDNAEGDWSINEVIATIALEYDLPLWNFWASIQDLPNHGIDDARPEGNYLTREAWEVRSITGLQVLDVVWNDLKTVYDPNAEQ